LGAVNYQLVPYPARLVTVVSCHLVMAEAEAAKSKPPNWPLVRYQ
jgi:hypothetical protein